MKRCSSLLAALAIASGMVLIGPAPSAFADTIQTSCSNGGIPPCTSDTVTVTLPGGTTPGDGGGTGTGHHHHGPVSDDPGPQFYPVSLFYGNDTGLGQTYCPIDGIRQISGPVFQLPADTDYGFYWQYVEDASGSLIPGTSKSGCAFRDNVPPPPPKPPTPGDIRDAVQKSMTVKPGSVKITAPDKLGLVTVDTTMVTAVAVPGPINVNSVDSQFNGWYSVTASAKPSKYVWNMGNGHSETTTVPSVTYAYPHDSGKGSFAISVEITWDVTYSYTGYLNGGGDITLGPIASDPTDYPVTQAPTLLTQ